MSAARRGNPYLQVRLPEELLDTLKERHGADGGGKSAGVGLFVRRLIYRELGIPVPKQWGQPEDKALNAVISLESDFERWERDGFDEKAARSLRRGLLDAVKEEDDPLVRNLCYQYLGRVTDLLTQQPENQPAASTRQPRSFSKEELRELIGDEVDEIDFDTPFEPTPGIIPMDEKFDPADY